MDNCPYCNGKGCIYCGYVGTFDAYEKEAYAEMLQREDEMLQLENGMRFVTIGGE